MEKKNENLNNRKVKVLEKKGDLKMVGKTSWGGVVTQEECPIGTEKRGGGGKGGKKNQQGSEESPKGQGFP